MKKFFIALTMVALSFGCVSAVCAEDMVKVHSVEAFFQNLYPVGEYADYLTTTIGAGAQLNLAVPAVPALSPFAAIEYGYGISKDDRISSFNDIGFTVGAGWVFPVAPRFSVEPELGYGVLVHLVNADLDDSGETAVSVYSDQYMRLLVKGLYSLNEKISLTASPIFLAFLENDNTGLQLGFQLGARFGL